MLKSTFSLVSSVIFGRSFLVRVVLDSVFDSSDLISLKLTEPAEKKITIHKIVLQKKLHMIKKHIS